MSQWRALMTRPQFEHVAAASLKELGVVTFYPWRQLRRYRLGERLIVRRVSYFPGYVFADFGSSVWPVNTVRSVNGIHRIVGTVAISEDVMVELMARADADGFIADPGPSHGVVYHVGHLLTRYEGLDRRQRARVLVRLFGQDRVATVPLAELQTVAE